MGVTATLCERIAAWRYQDLPEATKAAARRPVPDGIAVGGAGVAAAVPAGFITNEVAASLRCSQ